MVRTLVEAGVSCCFVFRVSCFVFMFMDFFISTSLTLSHAESWFFLLSFPPSPIHSLSHFLPPFLSFTSLPPSLPPPLPPLLPPSPLPLSPSSSLIPYSPNLFQAQLSPPLPQPPSSPTFRAQDDSAPHPVIKIRPVRPRNPIPSRENGLEESGIGDSGKEEGGEGSTDTFGRDGGGMKKGWEGKAGDIASIIMFGKGARGVVRGSPGKATGVSGEIEVVSYRKQHSNNGPAVSYIPEVMRLQYSSSNATSPTTPHLPSPHGKQLSNPPNFPNTTPCCAAVASPFDAATPTLTLAKHPPLVPTT